MNTLPPSRPLYIGTYPRGTLGYAITAPVWRAALSKSLFPAWWKGLVHRSQGSRNSPQDRRAYIRYDLPPGWELAAALSAPGGAALQAAHVRDLSVGGVGVLAEHRLAPGSEAFLHVTDPSAGKHVMLPLLVRHVSVTSDGRYVLGCQYETNPTDSELVMLFARATEQAVARGVFNLTPSLPGPVQGHRG